MADLTQLLARWHQGDRDALGELMPLVYGELRQLADRYMLDERRNHTLQPTALVHEAFLRLAATREAGFNNRVHFYGAAAKAMRRILVDHGRRRLAAKRGDALTLLTLDDAPEPGVAATFDVVVLDDAITRLAGVAPRAAEVVELRFFAGMAVEEVAEFMGISPATVKRHWSFARAWLFRAMTAR